MRLESNSTESYKKMKIELGLFDSDISEKIEKLVELNIESRVEIVNNSKEKMVILVFNETKRKDNIAEKYYEDYEVRRKKSILFHLRNFVRKILFYPGKECRIIVYLNFSRFFKYQLALTFGFMALPIIMKIVQFIDKKPIKYEFSDLLPLYVSSSCAALIGFPLLIIFMSRKIYKPILGNSNITYRFCWK